MNFVQKKYLSKEKLLEHRAYAPPPLRINHYLSAFFLRVSLLKIDGAGGGDSVPVLCEHVHVRRPVVRGGVEHRAVVTYHHIYIQNWFL